MRRTLLTICVVLLGIASAATAAADHTQSQLQANQRAARADAQQLVGLIQVPAGLSDIQRVPAFAQGLTGSVGPARYAATSSRFWSTSASPQSVIAYVQAHPPKGASAEPGSGSSSDGKTGVTSVDVQFSWPEVSGRLLNRELTVTVVTPRSGDSVVVAQSQSDWFVPRSVAERVPSDVQAVAITLRLGPSAIEPVMRPGAKVHTTTYLIWRPARVRALVSLFDGLPIVQPATEPIACPLMLTGSEASTLTLAFRTSRSGPTVARVQVSARRGHSSYDGAGPCDPIDFWIGAKQQTALMSPNFVKQVGSMIGADIS